MKKKRENGESRLRKSRVGNIEIDSTCVFSGHIVPLQMKRSSFFHPLVAFSTVTRLKQTVRNNEVLFLLSSNATWKKKNWDNLKKTIYVMFHCTGDFRMITRAKTIKNYVGKKLIETRYPKRGFQMLPPAVISRLRFRHDFSSFPKQMIVI